MFSRMSIAQHSRAQAQADHEAVWGAIDDYGDQDAWYGAEEYIPSSEDDED